MSALFNPQNWSDIVHEDSFFTLAAILTLGLSTLMLVLFSDRIRQWHDERRERAKWLHWNS